MNRIIKSLSFEDIPSYDKEYWGAKSPRERLDAALKLILHAREIHKSNPINPPLANGTGIYKSDSPIERIRR